MTELHWLSARQISEAYAERRLSPVELVRGLLHRISVLDPQLNAFVALDCDAALDAARVAEAEIMAGRARGPLHGIPVGVKDIIDIAGLPTTCHSKILLGNIPAEDASVISRLRAAGAILMGKLSLHEFAIGGPSFDLPFPPARNPWNVAHHPGGSSSGCGAAVGAGLVPLALGTDTGGSIRNPAGACGIVGLKPTYGLVSRRGVYPLAFTLDHIGPMARSVGDSALLLDAIAGHDPRDPGSARDAFRPSCADLDRGARGLRIGFVRHFHETDMVADAEVAAALEDVARILTREGAYVRPIKLPPLSELAAVQRLIMQAEAWTIHSKWLGERPADYARTTRRKLLTGAFYSAADYVRAQQHRLQMIASVNDAFFDADVLLTVNAMEPACRIDDADELSRTYPRNGRRPFNLTGHPAIALMCGLSKTGLPLSVQFVGRTHDETTLLRVAAAYERASEWHTCHPPAP